MRVALKQNAGGKLGKAAADQVESRPHVLQILGLFVGVVLGLILFLYMVLQLEDLQQFQNSTQFALVLLGLSTVYGIMLIGLAETTKKVAGILFTT